MGWGQSIRCNLTHYVCREYTNRMGGVKLQER